MRLIDADKIRILTDLEDESGEAVVTLADVRRAIQQTPTEDAEIVKHGHWEYVTDEFVKCSVCGCYRNVSTQYGWGHCPSDCCGAKMDGEIGDKR